MVKAMQLARAEGDGLRCIYHGADGGGEGRQGYRGAHALQAAVHRHRTSFTRHLSSVASVARNRSSMRRGLVEPSQERIDLLLVRSP